MLFRSVIVATFVLAALLVLLSMNRSYPIAVLLMVLGLRAPQGTEPPSLLPTLPAIATFALSFILIGISLERQRAR